MHYIFEVHIGPGYTPEQYADAWERASRYIQKAPGAQGTRLHRKIGPQYLRSSRGTHRHHTSSFF